MCVCVYVFDGVKAFTNHHSMELVELTSLWEMDF